MHGWKRLCANESEANRVVAMTPQVSSTDHLCSTSESSRSIVMTKQRYLFVYSSAIKLAYRDSAHPGIPRTPIRLTIHLLIVICIHTTQFQWRIKRYLLQLLLIIYLQVYILAIVRL
jgi:hypothetical protein